VEVEKRCDKTLERVVERKYARTYAFGINDDALPEIESIVTNGLAPPSTDRSPSTKRLFH